MFKYRWLTKKYTINLISFLHKYITFTFLHILLQSIVRRKRNSSKLFNSKIFIRPFFFIRNFSEFGKIKLVRISLNSVKTFSFWQSIIAPQVFKKGLPKIIGQVLLASLPSTRKSAGYLVLPHRTSTSLTIPIEKIVSLLALITYFDRKHRNTSPSRLIRM